MEEETVVVTRRVDPERRKSTVNGENRMLMEVVDPEPLTGDHVPFRNETGKSEFMEGERGVVVEKGRQGQSKEAFSSEWKLTGDSEVIIEKRGHCRSLKTSSGGRKSGVRSLLLEGLSVNVTDDVTQSITDDVGRSGC
jgi:hypothetical protein